MRQSAGSYANGFPLFWATFSNKPLFGIAKPNVHVILNGAGCIGTPAVRRRIKMTENDPPQDAKAGETDIFFSYARTDQKRALAIIRALEAAGYRVWWDGVIEGGARYLKPTEDALESACAIVVLWSAASVGSHWVLDEAGRGRDRKCLVPLGLDGSKPPLGFGQFQVIDFSKWRSKPEAPAFQSLLRSVSALRDNQPLTPVLPKKELAGATVRRRQILLGGAGAALLGLGGAAYLGTRPRGAKLSGNEIAVLPFENISANPAHAYLSDGISAELRTTLSRNAALKVVGQTSSESFRSTDKDAVSIAKALGVSFLLDGNVRISENVVRISTELIDGKSGFSRWSQSYDRSMEDILAVQREIAAAVTSALAIEVTTGSGGTRQGGARNAAAYDDYLKGLELYKSAIDEASDLAALARFDSAIAIDPSFAEAHAARARSLTSIGNTSSSAAKAGALYADAVKAAQRAVELEPDLADAHSTLGFTLFQAQLQVKAARVPFDTSRKLGFGMAAVMARFAIYCAATGRDADAKMAMERAQDLDPLNPTIHRSAGFVHYAARRTGDAISSVRRALELNPKLSDSHARIGMALFQSGSLREGVAACELETSGLVGLPCLAIGKWRLGDQDGARAAMTQLKEKYGDGGLYQQAQVLAQWGEQDKAMAVLASAKALGDSGLIYLKVDPALDPLRERPDFFQLLTSLGFE
jgi:TolB-like protein